MKVNKDATSSSKITHARREGHLATPILTYLSLPGILYGREYQFKKWAVSSNFQKSMAKHEKRKVLNGSTTLRTKGLKEDGSGRGRRKAAMFAIAYCLSRLRVARGEIKSP